MATDTRGSSSNRTPNLMGLEESALIHQVLIGQSGLKKIHMSAIINSKLSSVKEFGGKSCRRDVLGFSQKTDVSEHMFPSSTRRTSPEEGLLDSKVRHDPYFKDGHIFKNAKPFLRDAFKFSLCYLPMILVFCLPSYIDHESARESLHRLNSEFSSTKEERAMLMENITFKDDIHELKEVYGNLMKAHESSDEEIKKLFKAYEDASTRMEEENCVVSEYVGTQDSEGDARNTKVGLFEHRLRLIEREEILNVNVGATVNPVDKTVEDLMHVMSKQMYKSWQVGKRKLTDVHLEIDFVNARGQNMELEFGNGHVYRCRLGHRTLTSVMFRIYRPPDTAGHAWPVANRALFCLVDPPTGRLVRYQVLEGRTGFAGTPDEFVNFGYFSIKVEELKYKNSFNRLNTVFIFYNHPAKPLRKIFRNLKNLLL